MVGDDRIDRVFAGIHGVAEGGDQMVGVAFLDGALGFQAVGVQLAGAGVNADALVHQRLGDGRGVLLVVAQLAEADDVDDHVLAELHPVVERQLGDEDHGFGIVAVDVEDRCLDGLDHVGAVERGTRVARVGGGETDLVVDDEVHRAARAVATGLGQVQRLHDDALAGEGCVTVDHDRQHVGAVAVAAAHLARLGGAFDHGADDLEVRRVEGQRQVHGTCRGGNIAGEALVVLHITAGQVGRMPALEFGEQVLGHLAQHVDQQVQAAAVGGADDHFLQAVVAALAHQFVHGGDEALAAFQREALLADVAGVQVTLQALGGGQPLKDAFLLLGTEAEAATHGFEALLDPALGGRIGHVHELGADGAAVGFAQRLHDLAQRCALKAEEGVGGRVDVGVVALGEAVERRRQLGNLGAFAALQGIEIGVARTQTTVGGDQLCDIDLLAGRFHVAAHLLGLQRAFTGTLGKRLDDRRMSHVAGFGIAIGRGQRLQVVEVRTPGLIDRGRIGEVAFVQLLDERGIAAEQVRVLAKGAHHVCFTCQTSFSLKSCRGESSRITCGPGFQDLHAATGRSVRPAQRD